MTVFVPFFLLAYLNYRIVRTLRDQQRSAQMFRLSSDHKSKIRSATRLLVLIVCSYLLANVLNVLITLWEYVAFQSTQTKDAYVIYEFCTDVISVLYVLVCATRLFVYISCNKEIRDAMFEELYPNYSSKNKGGEKFEAVKAAVSGQHSSRQFGTDADTVAIAIAQRLIQRNNDADETNDDDPNADSPLTAIVYANDHARTNEIL